MGSVIGICVAGLGMYVAGAAFATHHARIGLAGLIVTAIGIMLMVLFMRRGKD